MTRHDTQAEPARGGVEEVRPAKLDETAAATLSTSLWVRITGSAYLASNKWTYVGVEQELSNGVFVDKSGGQTLTDILNAAEANNAATGVQGNSVDQDGVDYPAGFSLRPIRGNPVVQVWQVWDTGLGAYAWVCQYENADDGTCE